MKIAQIQRVRDDLFDEELDAMEARQRAPRGRRRDFTPIMSFDDQDEVDAQTAQDLRDMQRDYFGKPGGMGTGKHEKPWVKDQLDPFRDREPTKDELEEIERNVKPDDLGISERELTQILDQEYGAEMPDDFTEDAASPDPDDEVPVDWTFRQKLTPKAPSQETSPIPAPAPKPTKQRNY